MKEISVRSPAKVNLFLEVLEKREDGYHNVETVLETVDLCDDIILKETKEGIKIACPPSLPARSCLAEAGGRSGVSRRESDFPSLPLGRENLAYQAAFLLKKRLGIEKGIQLTINKKIPLASGLGGGSSNGASVLLGLNKLWDLDLSYEKLLGLAREIGADVPFFLRKGRALGRGRGDELRPLPQSPILHFVLIFPGFEISAEWAYKNLRDLTKERQSIKIILSALKSGDIGKVANNIYNRLEEAVIPKYPLIARIKERLLELGARGTLMSGSGSSVFGLVEDGKIAKEIYDKIKKDFKKIFLLKSFKQLA